MYVYRNGLNFVAKETVIHTQKNLNDLLSFL